MFLLMPFSPSLVHREMCFLDLTFKVWSTRTLGEPGKGEKATYAKSVWQDFQWRARPRELQLFLPVVTQPTGLDLQVALWSCVLSHGAWRKARALLL